MVTDTNQTPRTEAEPKLAVGHVHLRESDEATSLPNTVQPKRPKVRELRIYSHSSLFYWWPVWFVGYVMTMVTYLHGRPTGTTDNSEMREWFHPSNNPGVIYFLVLFLVILITNFSVRGLASGMVILGGVLASVLLAWFGWWDEVFSWLHRLNIHLTLGAYFWFSTLMFLTWSLTVFGLDRLSYWEVTAGQLTRKSLFGADSQSYNAQGMALEKHRDDLFRHWLLGIGSGDLRIRTSGGVREQLDVENVLFIGSKVEIIQRLISEVPEEPDSD